MKIYVGQRGLEGCQVTVNGKPLPLRLDLLSLSPDGFEWGYSGGGPGQLALAILAEHLNDDSRAKTEYPRFRDTIIATFTDDNWSLDESQINAALSDTVMVPMTLAQLLNKVRGI